MIFWLAAAALAAAVVALHFNARRYVRWANAKWPPQGRFVEADGASLHVRETGPEGAPRILLIHGASSNLLELWGPLADEFAPLHRVIAYDRPGLGHSTRAKRDAQKLASQARGAARVLEATGDGPALIVAHSLGSAVALRLAMDHPSLVQGLVLIAPAANPYPGKNAWWARLSSTPLLGDLFCGLIIPWLAPMLASASVANNFWPGATPVNYAEDAGLGLIFRPAAFQASARDVVATNPEFAAQAPRYADLFTPTVIVMGDKDKIVWPKVHGRALAVTMPAAELVIAPGAGHMPHRLRTDLVIAAIRRVNEMASQTAEG
jgi:pimeloyl-ACP methyl ester carboxylesterase